MSGDLAKNFRNEAASNLDPGVFQALPISNAARFLTREFIQNTVDASRDPWFTSLRGSDHVIVKFRFEELVGQDKVDFVSCVDLSAMASRSQQLPDGSAAKQPDTALADLDSDRPLRLLFIEEYGASGMYGPINDDAGTSKMTLALLTMNDTEKPAGAGGAYGQGKSVNAMASKIRLNVAYTCFPEDRREPGVTRRLLGVAYWPVHNVGVPRFTGWGRWGSSVDLNGEREIVPWENEEADLNASSLGFRHRDSAQRSDCGTSMLIVDPDVDPVSIRRAVERYWWPAIADGRLQVSVQEPNGRAHVIDPSADPLLKSFEETYRAIRNDVSESATLYRRPGATVLELGKRSGDLALVPGVSLGDQIDDGRQSSLVAYVRGLGMVVKYRTLAIGPVFVQGSFLSNQDAEIETLLNQSENKTHYDWLDNPDIADPGTKEKARLLVQNINNSVYAGVKEFSRRLTPDNPDRPTIVEVPPIMRPLLTEEGEIVPPGDRKFSINRQRPRKRAVGENEISVSGRVTITRLDPDVESCEVTINYFLLEEDSRGDTLHLAIKPPPGFTSTGDPSAVNTFVGPIGNESLLFEWSTPDYNRAWVGDLDIEVLSHGT